MCTNLECAVAKIASGEKATDRRHCLDRNLLNGLPPHGLSKRREVKFLDTRFKVQKKYNELEIFIGMKVINFYTYSF